MRMICSTAEGMDSIFESNMLKPMRFGVSDRYDCTGVAGIYATRPMKYNPHTDESLQALRTSRKVAGSLIAVNPLAGSSRRIRFDHYDFFAFCVPGVTEEVALGGSGGIGGGRGC